MGRAVAALLLIATAIGVCWAYWDQPWPATYTAGKTAHHDGVYYYAYLRSLGIDGDLDFGNDYQLLGDPWRSPPNPVTGRIENMFGIGTALFWSPLFALARAVFDSPDGTSQPFQFFVFFGSCLYGLAAVGMTYLVARRAYREGDAVFAALAALFGTPLFWYMTRQPCYSHALSAFTAAWLVLVWLRGYGSLAPLRWFVLGLICGLNMLVRASALVHAVVPAFELLGKRDLRARAIAGAAFGAGALLAFVPQMIAWKILFGQFWTVPQGSNFMMWSSSRFLSVLFTTRQGWIAWHPLVGLGIVGLIVASVRSTLPAPMRKLAQAGLVAIALAAYLNGATGDWYGGWAFGGRRFTDNTIYVALGVAQVFALLGERSLYESVSRALRVSLPALLACAVAWFSFDMSEHYMRGEMVDHPQPMGRYWKGAIDRAFDATYAFTGNLGSIPENWWFASRGGVSPERWDLSGDYEPIELTVPFLFPFHMRWVALAGYGDELQYETKRCRWLLGSEGTFTFTQRKSMKLRARLTMAGVLPGTHVALRMDGQPVFEADLDATLKEYSFEIPQERVATGSNFVQVVQTFPANAENEIGDTGVKLAHDVAARSAGWAVGMSASLAIDGVSTPGAARGLTMFWLDGSGRQEKFDSFADPTAADRLLATVTALPARTPVALTVADEASTFWNERGDAAIRALGGQRSLIGAYRASYALIGVKDAAPGSAIESFSTTHAVHATLGRPYSKSVRGTIWHELWLEPAP